MNAIIFSKFDHERLSAGLFLIQHIDLSKVSFPLLLDFINQFPSNEDIVSICCSLTSSFPINAEFIEVSSQFNVVQKTVFAMDAQFANKAVALMLLTFTAVVSSIPQLISQFSEPVVLIKLANMFLVIISLEFIHIYFYVSLGFLFEILAIITA